MVAHRDARLKRGPGHCHLDVAASVDDRVVDHGPHRSTQPPLIAGDHDRGGLDREACGGVVPPGGSDDLVHQDVEVDRGQLGRCLLASGQLDEPVDEVAELGQLLVEIGQQLGLVLGPEPRSGAQQVDVGPQARQWRAQLMGGIGDQLGLRGPGLLQAHQHAVEGPPEAGQLVVALRGDAGVELLGAGDVLGGGGERADGPHEPVGHQQRRRRGPDGEQPADHQQPGRQLCQGGLDLGEAPPELHGAAPRQRDREQPHRCALDRDGLERGAGPTPGNLVRGGGHRQRRFGGRGRRTVGCQHLQGPVDAEQRRDAATAGWHEPSQLVERPATTWAVLVGATGATGAVGVAGVGSRAFHGRGSHGRRCHLGEGAQIVVDRGQQGVARDLAGDHQHQHDGQDHHHGGPDRGAPAEGHRGGRRT